MTSKTIAKITPLIRLPSQVDVFDYFIPADLEAKIKIGQMVSVPWRNRYVNGVVLSLDEPPHIPPLVRGGGNFRARPIKKIIEPQPVLTPAQFTLIKKFSNYYFVTAGSVARLIAPTKPTRLGKPSSVLTRNQQPVSFKIAKSQLPLLEQVINPLLGDLSPESLAKGEEGEGGGTKRGREFLEIQDISSFIWLVFYLLKNGFPPSGNGRGRNDKSGTLLLLVPTINLIEIIAAALIKHQAQVAVIHSGLSLGAYWQAYQKILNHQARIILSTRQGVFLPIATNSTIVMFDSASQDFKQYDQHPRYDARLVASWLAELTKSQLILISPSPLPLGEGGPPASQDEALRAGVRGALPPATRQKTVVKLIDMKQNLQSPEFSIIADEVIEEIAQAQTMRKKAVIIALREQADKGVSVNKINDALTKIIKDDINVIPNPAQRGKESPFSDGRDPSPSSRVRACPERSVRDDMVVATPHLLESGQLLPYRGQIACLVLASIEPLLAIPDYRAGERAFYRLKHWQMWAQELAIPKIILQSYSPENPAVRAFAYNETEHFVQTELENRKRFLYPPFAQLIKLTYQGKDNNEVNRVAALLKSCASDKLTVRGPYQAHKSEKKSILLKIKNGADLSPLATLSSAWAIDRDPENVL